MSENTMEKPPDGAAPQPAESAHHTAAAAPNCWNEIGVFGDDTCPELAKVVHCRNCPVYEAAGRGLLDRDLPESYRSEWSAVLARHETRQEGATQSIVVFSLGSELLALPTPIFREVTEFRVVHRMPMRSTVLLGLVNIRGEIQLCVSLAILLGIMTQDEERERIRAKTGRLMVVEQSGEAWVFPVDRVFGTFRYNKADVRGVPSTLEKGIHNYSRGTIEWESRTAGCLNEELLFAALKKGIV